MTSAAEELDRDCDGIERMGEVVWEEAFRTSK